MQLSNEKGLIAAFGKSLEQELAEKVLKAGFLAAGIDYKYHVVEIEENEIEQAVKSARFFNVHGFSLEEKLQSCVLPYLDRLSPVAKITGFVNVVANHDGEYIGENSDAKSLVTALMLRDILAQGHTFAVEGKDKLALLVLAELAISGADHIDLYTEDKNEAKKLIEKLAKESDTEIVWKPWTKDLELSKNVDIFVGTSKEEMDYERILSQAEAGNVLICHMNLLTYDGPFLSKAREKGLQVIDGKEIFFHKLRLHYSLWTEHFTEMDVMIAALEEGLDQIKAKEEILEKESEQECDKYDNDDNCNKVRVTDHQGATIKGTEISPKEHLLDCLYHELAQDHLTLAKTFALQGIAMEQCRKKQFLEEEKNFIEVASLLLPLCQKQHEKYIAIFNEKSLNLFDLEEKMEEYVWNLMEKCGFVEDFTDRVCYMVLYMLKNKENDAIYIEDLLIEVLKDAWKMMIMIEK